MMSGFFMIRFSLYCRRSGCWVSDNQNHLRFRTKSDLCRFSTAVLHHQAQRGLQFLRPNSYFFLPPFLPPAALSPAALSSGVPSVLPAASPGGAPIFSPPVEAGLALSPPPAFLSAAALSAAALSAAAFSLAAFSA